MPITEFGTERFKHHKAQRQFIADASDLPLPLGFWPVAIYLKSEVTGSVARFGREDTLHARGGDLQGVKYKFDPHYDNLGHGFPGLQGYHIIIFND